MSENAHDYEYCPSCDRFWWSCRCGAVSPARTWLAAATAGTLVLFAVMLFGTVCGVAEGKRVSMVTETNANGKVIVFRRAKKMKGTNGVKATELEHGKDKGAKKLWKKVKEKDPK